MFAPSQGVINPEQPNRNMMKSFYLLFTSFIIGFACVAQVPSYVPNDGLVAWYEFDNDVADASDNAHNGSVYGASFVESPLNGAVSFDGSDDYLEIPTSPVFEDMVHELTLSSWFKKSNSNTGTIVAKRNFVGNPCGERHHFELTCMPDNSLLFSASHNCIDLHNTQVQSAPDAFQLNEWTHVAVTYDNGALLMYVNGQVVVEHDEGYRELLPNNHWINFGRIHRSGGNPFFNEYAGDIDESGIWDRVLLPMEIQSLYQGNENPAILGCMDETACNYNSEATEDDGSCITANILVDDQLLCETGVVAMSVFQNAAEGEPRSLSFSQGQYVRIPMSSSLSNFTDYTMEFWYYETGGHGSDEMIVGTEFFSGNRYGIYSFVDGYWPYIRDNSTFLGLGYNGSNPNAGVSYNMNEWNHIAISYDGSTFRFFVNGQLSYSESGSVSGFGPLTEDLVINRHTWNSGSSSRLAGQLDELRISDIARYTSNFSPPQHEFQNDLNTKGLWHFNEGSGGTVYDASSNSNHGSCLGTGWSENTPITQSLTEGYDVFWNGGEESTPTYNASPGETVEVVIVGELESCSEVINIAAYELEEGCADEDACNYSETAACNLGCVYPVLGAGDCNEGSVTCGPGTVWDAENQTCVVAIPAYLNEPGEAAILNPCYFDSNGNGLVEVTDLMNVLSVYGMACGEIPEAEEFTCGNPLSYQGYDYETVLIGEQCWFAENTRYLPVVSPVLLGSEDDGMPHAYVYGYDGVNTSEAVLEPNYQTYGALYNYEAVQAWELCPTGWSIPNQIEWDILTTNNSVSDCVSTSWFGTNLTGFDFLPGGDRDGIEGDNDYVNEGSAGLIWIEGDNPDNPIEVGVYNEDWYIYGVLPTSFGLSIRCIKDSE